MKMQEILHAVGLELKRAKKKSWPDHVAAQVGYITDESGKLMGAALRQKYNDQNKAKHNAYLRAKAIKTIVMCVRFLENLK